jgi:hypothetical protein
MGSSTSTLVSKSARDELLRSTQPTRVLMDKILDFLMREVKPKDFVNLSSATECSKYVVFLADMFDKIFIPLRVVPSKDSKGVIMFRKVDDLRDDTKLPNRRALCISLGYFYTKLFQIIGALSYSVFDESYMRVAAGYGIGAPGAGAAVLPPGAYYRGGGLERIPPNFGNFKILAKYITNTNKSGRYYFDKKVDSRITIQLDIQNGYGIIYMYEKSTSELILKADIKISRESVLAKDGIELKTYLISFDKIKENEQEYFLDQNYTNIDVYYDDEDDRYLTISSPNQRVDTAIINRLQKMHELIRTGAYRGALPGRPYGDIRKDERRRLYERYGKKSKGEGLLAHRARIIRPEKDERLEALLSAGTRPVAHCVARALQLLDIDALGPKMPQAARSYICMSKFNEQIQKTIPAPGGSFSKNTGLEYLSTLFTIFYGSEPKLLDPLKAQYMNFLNNMAKAVGTKATIRSSSKEINTLHHQLIDNNTKAFCSKKSADIPLTLTDSSLSVTRSGVDALFKRQIAHSIEVNKLLRMIFEITPQGNMRIHPQILGGGIPALDMISQKARELLMAYYEGCELTYQVTLNQLAPRAI